MPGPKEYLEPIEEKVTHWKNPLPVPQRVDIHHEGNTRPTRYIWKPGETKSLPSIYDNAIQRVDKGVIIGGLAPQLVKVGVPEDEAPKLDPALDTEAVARKQAEVDAARAAAAKKQAEDALVAAGLDLKKAEDAEAAKAAAKAETEAPKASEKPAKK